MRNWFFWSSLLLIHPTAIEIYMVLERDRKEHWSVCACIRHPCQLQLTPSTLFFKALASFMAVLTWLNAPTSMGFNQTEQQAKFQLYSFSQLIPHSIISSGTDAFHWRYSAPLVHSYCCQEAISPLLSKIFIELWGFISQCITSTCALNLTLYICKAWLGYLTYLISFLCLRLLVVPILVVH